MKRIIIYITLLIFTTTACNDFLEQEPGTQTSVDEIFSTYEGFKMSLNGCYYDLEAALSGERNAVYADALGGNINFTPSETSYEISAPYKIENVYSFSDVSDDSDMSTIYQSLYELINEANLILEHISSLEDATDDQKSQLKAECLCIRAISHFYLVRYYAQNYSYTSDASHPGIICNTKTQEVGVDYPARNTVKETYDIIIADLQNAIDYFKSETILEGAEYSYFTSTSCKALLSKVALYAEDYQLAIDYSSDVILNSGINLLTTDNYVSEWKKTNTPVSEIIFELSAKIDDEGDYKNTLSGFYGIIASEADYSDYSANQDLLNLFEENDVRGSEMYTSYAINKIIGDEAEAVLTNYYFTNKFQDNPGNPILRLSEIYLIRAEAYSRLDEPENALTDLNSIRENRGSTPALISDDLLEEIFLERRKELCFEGELFFDIARFHKDVERYSDCIASTCNLDYPSNYFVLPIPKNSTDLNSNLEQNEGYY